MQSVNVTIYSSKGEGLPGEVERETIPPGLLDDYLAQHDPDHHDRVIPLVTVKVNRHEVPFALWGETLLKGGDHVEIQLEPQGIELTLFQWFIVAVTAVTAAYSVYVAGQIPDNAGQSSRPQGSSIYRSDLQANTPKKNGTIPEIFGKMPRYPDLITPIRRKYIANEEWLYVGLSVGVGQYSIADADIRIGETPVANYATDVTYDIVAPGASASSIIANEHWYTTKEIGSTSGTSGLELRGGADVELTDTYLYDFSGKVITMTDALGVAVDWDLLPNDRTVITSTSELNSGYFRVSSVSGNELTVEKLTLIFSGTAISWEDDPDFTALVTETDVTAFVEYSSVGEWSTWFNVLPEGETTTNIEIDYRLPRGLGEYDDAGDLQNYSVQFQYEIREVGDLGTPARLARTTTRSTLDEVGETIEITLGSSYEPQIRFRRMTTEKNDSRILEEVEIVRVKGKLTAASSYSDITTAFFAIRATNAIAQAAENKLNMDAQRLLPTTAVYKSWKDAGAIGTPTHSGHSEIASPVIYLTLDAGYDADVVDIDTLNTLQTTWNSRADTFNAEISDESTLFELQKRILAVGYAEPTIEGGELTAKRDVARTTYDYIYTPDKILPPGIKRPGTFYDPDENDGVEIEYFNTTTRQNEVVYYTLTAAGDSANPINPKRLRAFGITDETKAWRFGSIDRRRSHYKPDQINFATELDGLNSTYLSSPAVADEMMLTGQWGRMVSFVNAGSYDTVTLDIEIDTTVAGPYRIAFSKPDGTMSTLFTATVTADAAVVDLSGVLDFTPVLDGSAEPPSFVFGPVDAWAQHVIVRDIQPQGDDTVMLICEEHISEIWDDIDGAPA